MDIRNIAIIAHVDHGKTTLTDALMRQTGAAKEGVSMDSNKLEQERGITIYSKNAAVIWHDTKINIIDKPSADPHKCEVQVLELFLELGATDEQANFPIVYAIGREGIAKRKLTDDSKDLTPLLEVILEHVPPASTPEAEGKPLRLQPFNLGYDNFLGRLAVCRVYEGVVLKSQNVFIKKPASTEVKLGS